MHKLRTLSENAWALAFVLMAVSILLQIVFNKFFGSGPGMVLTGLVAILGHIGIFILTLLVCGVVKESNARLVFAVLIAIISIIIQSELTGTDGGPQPLEKLFGLKISERLYR